MTRKGLSLNYNERSFGVRARNVVELITKEKIVFEYFYLSKYVYNLRDSRTIVRITYSNERA